MYNTTSELYNDLLWICFDKYNDLSEAKRSKIDLKYNPVKLILDEYDYNKWCKQKSVDEEELHHLPN